MKCEIRGSRHEFLDLRIKKKKTTEEFSKNEANLIKLDKIMYINADFPPEMSSRQRLMSKERSFPYLSLHVFL